MTTDDKTFQEALKRIPDIARAVNEFSSPELQEKAFHALMRAAGLDTDLSLTQVAGLHQKPKGRNDARKRGARKVRAESSVADGKKRQTESYQLIDIDFHAEGKLSLKQFIEQKTPRSDPERYACIVYYLKHDLAMEDITKDHIYTAFKALNFKVPNIIKGLYNTRGRRGWIDFSGQGPISPTRIGENFVVHDLPRKEEK